MRGRKKGSGEPGTDEVPKTAGVPGGPRESRGVTGRAAVASPGLAGRYQVSPAPAPSYQELLRLLSRGT